jgi:hypothetical protein
MKTEIGSRADRSDAYRRLDSVRMNPLQRKYARAGLRDGELLAAALLRAADDLRAIGAYAEHALTALAHGAKALFAKPAKH